MEKLDEDVAEDTVVETTDEPENVVEESVDEAAEKVEAEIDASETIAAPSIETNDEPVPVIVRRGGFFPMLLGGIVAAGIGFVAAQYIEPGYWPFGNDDKSIFETETAKTLASQESSIEGLNKQLKDLAAKSDTSGIEATANDAMGGVADIKDLLAKINAKMNDVSFRLSDLEKRPITEGISDAAIAAFEGEMKDVQDAMAAQRADISKASQAAAQMEANAQLSETEAMKRAALSQIQTALDTGSSFPAAIENLAAIEETVSDVLVEMADTGVPTLAELQGTFPKAARVALETSRAEDENGGGIGSFFRNQFGARSLTPKEGNSTDAVLSRAEAALKEGRLLDTTAELEALSDEAKVSLAGWIETALIRQNAMAAVEALGQQMNSN